MIKRDLQPGDMIKCHDKDDMLSVNEELRIAGYRTEFVYKQDGMPGYWILIEGRW